MNLLELHTGRPPHRRPHRRALATGLGPHQCRRLSLLLSAGRPEHLEVTYYTLGAITLILATGIAASIVRTNRIARAAEEAAASSERRSQ
jgi:hypothetical protein